MQISKIISILSKKYKIKSRKSKPFETLIHGILSTRTKGEVSFPAAEKLLKKANTPEKILKLSTKEIQKLIYPVGFYRVKAKNIRKACKFLIDNFGGKIPNTRKKLMEIPGVGGKIADIILLFSFGEKVIPVDVHVEVVSKRLGFVDKKDDPERVRKKLHKIIPKNFRTVVNVLFVNFGRDVCQTRKPLCFKCPVIKLCPYEPKNLEK